MCVSMNAIHFTPLLHSSAGLYSQLGFMLYINIWDFTFHFAGDKPTNHDDDAEWGENLESLIAFNWTESQKSHQKIHTPAWSAYLHTTFRVFSSFIQNVNTNHLAKFSVCPCILITTIILFGRQSGGGMVLYPNLFYFISYEIISS